MIALILSYAGVAIAIICLLYARHIWSLCLHLFSALKEQDALQEAYRANGLGKYSDKEDIKHK